jgi:DNA modification methylase
MINLKLGDCLDKLKEIEDNSVDSIVTDPPAGISFMGKAWDGDKGGRNQWIAWMQEVAIECNRVLKPGSHALVWAIPRTSHWTATAWENAGFEVRDILAHIFGSGFPKSHNVGKSIDKLQGNEREVTEGGQVASGLGGDRMDGGKANPDYKYTKGNSKWEGWGSALKPAREDWILLRKPLSEKTIALNVLKWGCGGINIDGSRVEATDGQTRSRDNSKCKSGDSFFKGKERVNQIIPEGQGRFPANIILDDSDEVKALFPDTKKGSDKPRNRNTLGSFGMPNDATPEYSDSGSAARFFKQIEIKPDDRFFYCAKTSKSDRNEGLEGFEEKEATSRMNDSEFRYQEDREPTLRAKQSVNKNNHPTVKPTKLMQYLIKLVTPTGGTCLDPFMGSGSSGKACKLEDFSFIGIEREEEYFKIAEARINNSKKDEQLTLF